MGGRPTLAAVSCFLKKTGLAQFLLEVDSRVSKETGLAPFVEPTAQDAAWGVNDGTAELYRRCSVQYLAPPAAPQDM